jgi:hypothetical protein
VGKQVLNYMYQMLIDKDWNYIFSDTPEATRDTQMCRDTMVENRCIRLYENNQNSYSNFLYLSLPTFFHQFSFFFNLKLKKTLEQIFPYFWRASKSISNKWNSIAFKDVRRIFFSSSSSSRGQFHQHFLRRKFDAFFRERP